MGLQNRYSLADMLLGYCISQVLFTANDLNLFTLLDGKTSDLPSIAATLGMPMRPLHRLLRACVGFGLLFEADKRYGNTVLASRFLVKGKPEYYGQYVSLMAQYYQPWSRLREMMAEDRPLRKEFADHVSADRSWARHFTLAMHSAAAPFAPYLARAVDLARFRRLLDVGGGSGVNALALLERNPSLKAVVFDFPTVCEIAGEVIRPSPVAARISTCAGNYKEDELPKGFDCALISQVLHAESPETCQEVLGKVFESLEPDGLVIIQDGFLNDEENGPLAALIYDLHWLLLTEEGRNYTVGEVKELLRLAGFDRIGTVCFPEPLQSHVVVVGQKPTIR